MIDYTVKITGDCDLWLAKTFHKNVDVLNAISEMRSHCIDNGVITFDEKCTIEIVNNYT